MLNVVILAAGMGKRMFSSLPKVLHTIAGRPMAGHVLEAARAVGADRIVLVHGHGGDQVVAALADEDVTPVQQMPQLGTGHALQQALPALAREGKTLVLYGDVPLISPATLAQMLSGENDQFSLLTVNLPNPTGYGRIVRDQIGRILRIVEEKDATAEEKRIGEVNTGIMALPSHRLADWLGNLSNQNAQGEYYLTDVVAMAVAEGMEIQTVQPSAAWEVEGVNNKVQLAALERTFQQVQAERLLLAGVQLADPARIDIRGTLSHEQDVFIDVGCVFEGEVSLGAGVRVGPYCVLKNVTVAAGTKIAAFCHLENAVVGESNAIGPFARLRPGAKLGPEVHIGNFVEIKNAVLGKASKANHLAYIGDAEIGERVNVGAGTITCNYDGVNKHKTIIEDDAFIGSDTQLVAPVRVGRGATLAAGTTLTKDAPPDALTVSRAKQLSLAGWKRPKKIEK